MWWIIGYLIGCVVAYIITAIMNDNNPYAVVKLPLIISFFSWASVLILILMSIPGPTLKFKKHDKHREK